MAKMLLSVKVEPRVKRAAQQAARELGLPLSLVVNENLRRFAVERSVTFSVPEKMSKKLERSLGRIDADIKAGRNLSPVFHSAKEMNDYLNAL